MSEKKYKDREWLRSKIYGEEKLQREVAEEAEVSQQTISRWMDKYDIPKRSKTETQRLLVDERLRSKNWLQEKYVQESKDISEIAGECDVGRGTVFRWLKRHEINTRSKGTGLYVKEELLDDEEWLEESYCEENYSLRDISQETNASPRKISDKLREHGIPVRSRGGLAGERNGRYLHGNDQLKYSYGSNWEERREEILSRDSYQCRSCGLTDDESLEKYNKSLHIHHIKPRSYFIETKEINFDEANENDNLVTLCPQCHCVIDDDGEWINDPPEDFVEKHRNKYLKDKDKP